MGINLFEIIETLYQNKEKTIYLNELCKMIRREYKDVKVDVTYLSSLKYAESDFIEDTVNQRIALLTPKAVSVMDREIPPKDYDEFIEMFANPEKDTGDNTSSDKKSIFKRVFGFGK